MSLRPNSANNYTTRHCYLGKTINDRNSMMLSGESRVLTADCLQQIASPFQPAMRSRSRFEGSCTKFQNASWGRLGTSIIRLAIYIVRRNSNPSTGTATTCPNLSAQSAAKVDTNDTPNPSSQGNISHRFLLIHQNP